MMQSTWPQEISEGVYRHFYSLDLGLPWNRKKDMQVSNISLAVFSPDFKEFSDHWKATFAIKIVISIDNPNLYAGT